MKKIAIFFVSVALFSSCTKTTTIAPSAAAPVQPNVYTDILNFNGTNGNYACGSITPDGIVLYGMTEEGGANNDGCIFSVYNNGTEYKKLHDFKLTTGDGALPTGSLTLSGGVLYGMTDEGGTYDRGIIFSIYTNGSAYKVLYNFGPNPVDGNYPRGSLLISGGVLYGMTGQGGIYGYGNVFSIETNGTNYKDLVDFNASTGYDPEGSLIISGNTLFGMTSSGGTNDYGTIFSVGTNGNPLYYLHNFDFSGGYYPQGSLTLSGNTLFGVAEGGLYGEGCAFSLHTDGSNFKDIFDFNATYGEYPYGSLVNTGNTLYGVTENGGGADNAGVIFSLDTNGSGYNILHTFNISGGADPIGSLTLWNNILYGMTISGGKDADGVVYSYSL